MCRRPSQLTITGGPAENERKTLRFCQSDGIWCESSLRRSREKRRCWRCDIQKDGFHLPAQTTRGGGMSHQNTNTQLKGAEGAATGWNPNMFLRTFGTSWLKAGGGVNETTVCVGVDVLTQGKEGGTESLRPNPTSPEQC